MDGYRDYEFLSETDSREELEQEPSIVEKIESDYWKSFRGFMFLVDTSKGATLLMISGAIGALISISFDNFDNQEITKAANIVLIQVLILLFVVLLVYKVTGHFVSKTLENREL